MAKKQKFLNLKTHHAVLILLGVAVLLLVGAGIATQVSKRKPPAPPAVDPIKNKNFQKLSDENKQLVRYFQSLYPNYKNGQWVDLANQRSKLRNIYINLQFIYTPIIGSCWDDIKSRIAYRKYQEGKAGDYKLSEIGSTGLKILDTNGVMKDIPPEYSQRFFDGSVCDCMRSFFDACKPGSRFSANAQYEQTCPQWPGLAGVCDLQYCLNLFNNGGYPSYSFVECLSYPGEWGGPGNCPQYGRSFDQLPQQPIKFTDNSIWYLSGAGPNENGSEPWWSNASSKLKNQYQQCQTVGSLCDQTNAPNMTYVSGYMCKEANIETPGKTGTTRSQICVHPRDLDPKKKTEYEKKHKGVGEAPCSVGNCYQVSDDIERPLKENYTSTGDDATYSEEDELDYFDDEALMTGRYHQRNSRRGRRPSGRSRGRRRTLTPDATTFNITLPMASERRQIGSQACKKAPYKDASKYCSAPFTVDENGNVSSTKGEPLIAPDEVCKCVGPGLNTIGTYFYPSRGVGYWQNVGNAGFCATKMGFLVTSKSGERTTGLGGLTNPNVQLSPGAGIPIKKLVGKYSAALAPVQNQIACLAHWLYTKQWTKEDAKKSTLGFEHRKVIPRGKYPSQYCIKNYANNGKKGTYPPGWEALASTQNLNLNLNKKDDCVKGAMALYAAYMKEGFVAYNQTRKGPIPIEDQFNAQQALWWPVGVIFLYSSAYDSIINMEIERRKYDTLLQCMEPQHTFGSMRPNYTCELIKLYNRNKKSPKGWDSSQADTLDMPRTNYLFEKSADRGGCETAYIINPNDDLENYTRVGYVDGSATRPKNGGSGALKFDSRIMKLGPQEMPNPVPWSLETINGTQN